MDSVRTGFYVHYGSDFIAPARENLGTETHTHTQLIASVPTAKIAIVVSGADDKTSARKLETSAICALRYSR